MKASKPALVNAAMVAALVAIGVLGHHYSPLLLPPQDLSAAPDPGCDLHRWACPAPLPGGGRIELSITPRPIPYLHTLRVEVTVQGVEARKVEVDFAGETMNMGFNRVALTAAADGRQHGEAALPVCVSGAMAWVATVIVEAGGRRVSVPYRFETGR